MARVCFYDSVAGGDAAHAFALEDTPALLWASFFMLLPVS
ncbi:uncharacterized protein G6M90_00g014620 [Metarhizium brunneum]|uniref:Uncharacterized protein n=1 Tax=Metarhizium brunneum TaxID=500148 RepID=A0A7D5US03_9HYPO|nr:hypothetical protein G6M90_00g014620 [Metarhizium brunneum]